MGAVKEIVRGNNAARVAAAARPRPVTATKVVTCSELLADGYKSAKRTTSGAEKRLLQELQAVATGKASTFLHSGQGIHILPDSGNPFLLKALIEAPSGSPFEGGVFALDVSVPSNYPFAAPSITFETPVYHCNVSDSGRVCLDILHDAWSPALTVPKAVEAVPSCSAIPTQTTPFGSGSQSSPSCIAKVGEQIPDMWMPSGQQQQRMLLAR